MMNYKPIMTEKTCSWDNNPQEYKIKQQHNNLGIKIYVQQTHTRSKLSLIFAHLQQLKEKSSISQIEYSLDKCINNVTKQYTQVIKLHQNWEVLWHQICFWQRITFFHYTRKIYKYHSFVEDHVQLYYVVLP